MKPVFSTDAHKYIIFEPCCLNIHLLTFTPVKQPGDWRKLCVCVCVCVCECVSVCVCVEQMRQAVGKHRLIQRMKQAARWFLVRPVISTLTCLHSRITNHKTLHKHTHTANRGRTGRGGPRPNPPCGGPKPHRGPRVGFSFNLPPALHIRRFHTAVQRLTGAPLPPSYVCFAASFILPLHGWR